MKFDFDVDVQNVLRNLESSSKEVVRAVNRETERTALKTKSNAIRGIQRAPAGGRTYTRGGVTHKASAAGEFPKTDTGNLVASIKTINKDTTGAIVEYLVGSSLDYAEWLEFGTLDMSARPWLMPSMRRAAKDHNKRLTQAIREANRAFRE